MKLFRAFGLILFLLATKTILLVVPYQDFEQTLSTFFQTTTIGLEQSQKIIMGIDDKQTLYLSDLPEIE